MIIGLLTGGLMLTVSAVLIGGAFRSRPSVQVGLPAGGARTVVPHTGASRLLQPKAGRYRIPVTRPGLLATPTPQPTPSPSPRNGPPDGTRASRSSRPDASRTPAKTAATATPTASPSSSPLDVRPTPGSRPYDPRPTLQEAGQADVRPSTTPEPHPSRRSRPSKTPRPARR